MTGPVSCPTLQGPSAGVTRREFVVGAAALTALALAACGSDDRDSSTSTTSVDDAFGATVIPKDPRRIVADSVSTYGHLASLGITPIAVAFPTGISAEYISPAAGEITNVVAEDGWTVDLEHVLTLDPDLIVAVGADYNEENCQRYRAAVPTFCFEETFATGTDEDIKDTLAGIAMALGREDEAAAAIAAYDQRVAELRDRVDRAGLAGTKVGIVRFDAAGFIGVRIDHAGNALLAALGFAAPDWPDADVDGYLQLGLETLELLDAADILLINTDDDVVVADLAAIRSPLWTSLEVVESGNAHFVTAWNGGDLPQMQKILDDIDTAIVRPAEAGG